MYFILVEPKHGKIFKFMSLINRIEHQVLRTAVLNSIEILRGSFRIFDEVLQSIQVNTRIENPPWLRPIFKVKLILKVTKLQLELVFQLE